MGLDSGYKLTLWCDCKKCQENPQLQKTGKYLSDSAHCKRKCFKDAQREGWRITKSGKCYAPKHKQPRAEEEVLN